MSTSFEPFSLEKILRLKKSKDSIKQNIIDYHYPRIISTIKEAYENYSDYCYYSVDPFVVNLPNYDSNKIAIKLVKFLQETENNEVPKYEAKILYQNKIHISWIPKTRPNTHIPILLGIIESRIENYAANDYDQCFLEVPVLLVELPWYNSEDATIEIGRILYDKGFAVKVKSNWIFVSWNVNTLKKYKKTKIEFKTNEEKRLEALEKINYINETRYIDFINPKTSKIDKNNYLLHKSKKENEEFSVDLSDQPKAPKIKHDSLFYSQFM